MRSREITLGRKASGVNVDVDLSLEGPAWKISRRQVSLIQLLINNLLKGCMHFDSDCHLHTNILPWTVAVIFTFASLPFTAHIHPCVNI